MATVLQGNLNGSSLAHALLPQIAEEMDADVVIISEPYRDRDSPTWFANTSRSAALWIRGRAASRVTAHGRGVDYVWARVADVTYVSVYLTPNCSAADFEQKVAALEDALRDIPGLIVLAGDVNARAAEWGMATTNKRGRLLLEMAARLDLAVANEGRVTTYRRPGYGASIPDVTFVTDGLLPKIDGWRVFEGYTASDHQYIVFGVTDRTRTGQRHATSPVGWNLSKLDRNKLMAQLDVEQDPATVVPGGAVGREKVEKLAEETAGLLRRLCDASMPRRRTRRDKGPMYWWTDEIACLRRECFSLRRRAQRSGGGLQAAAGSAEYRVARRNLRRAINDSKKKCWTKLIGEVDSDPWGAGYKIVTRNLGGNGPPVIRDEQTMDGIVDGLFPKHPEQVWREDEVGEREVPEFTPAELRLAVGQLAPRKAPGPDGIPAEVLGIVAKKRPEILLNLYNTCLVEGVFSKDWKTARLILIDKNKGGDPSLPSSYRPLSLLNTLGKLFEMLLRPRIQQAVQEAGGLNDRQYGFRKGRSTIGAIQKVVDSFDAAQTRPHKDRPVVLLATLDVRNAFNSARWADVVGVFSDTFPLPAYLLRVVKDYLRDRHITYATETGVKTRKLTAGVAQGSILGPDIWNVVYDEVLGLPMPPGVYLVAYADDLIIVIVTKSTRWAQRLLTRAMIRVDEWMLRRGLQLAMQKTELLYLTRRRIETTTPMMVGAARVRPGGFAKYLGVTLDTRMTFWPHISGAAKRAANKTAALSRLMANTKGPRPSVRRLLMAVTHSMLLYGAEIWAGAMRFKKYRKAVTAVQRIGALRIASAYRTVSEAAVLVIAGVVPVDLLALERKRIYETREEMGKLRAATEARTETLQSWQTRWTNSDKDRWTRRLITDVRQWTERGTGDVNFYLTQFLSGHGYFRHYLHRMGKVTTPSCTYCGFDRDDVEHTFFNCPRWAVDRQRLETVTGLITPDNVTTLMLSSKQRWDDIARYVTMVLQGKRTDGCLEN